MPGATQSVRAREDVPTSANAVNIDPVRTAVRFPLHLDIVLKTADREYAAVTEDVSANGVLFRAEELPAIGEGVEFKLMMPSTIMGGNEDVALHCKGRIVRHIPEKKMAAAVIDEYSLKAEHA
jgi:hypothetical protein